MVSNGIEVSEARAARAANGAGRLPNRYRTATEPLPNRCRLVLAVVAQQILNLLRTSSGRHLSPVSLTWLQASSCVCSSFSTENVFDVFALHLVSAFAWFRAASNNPRRQVP